MEAHLLLSRRAMHAVALLGFAVSCAALYIVDPRNGPVLCPFRALTGHACPGCGTVRAAHSLLHGEAGAAFDHNALGVLALPVALYALASSASVVLSGRSLRVPTFPRSTGWVAAGIALAFGIARNLPLEPFAALAP